MNIPMTKDDEKQLSATIAFNVRVMLAARNETQAALADALGLKKPAMSMKMSGKTNWSVIDLVNASLFLNASVESLLNGDLMYQLQGDNRKATGDTPMASGKLLRLGLNQRPSD